jgi:CRISPR-associated protein Cas2
MSLTMAKMKGIHDMVVIFLERVTPGLRGLLTRWFLEPQAGVFVGDVSALVRERVWEETCRRMRDGGGMLIYSTNNEQGFDVRYWGMTNRQVRDFDGLRLICQPVEVDEQTYRRKRRRASTSDA